jgi:hypothetical protein
MSLRPHLLIACALAPLSAQDSTPSLNDAASAQAAEASASDRFSGRARLSYGYDSNITLLPDEVPIVTEEESAAVIADARATWRAVDSSERKLAVVGTAELDEFPEHDEHQLLHYGLAVNGMLAWRTLDPGLSFGLHRYVLDGDRAAMLYHAALQAAHTRECAVDIPALAVEHVDYDGNDGSSGTLYSVGHRHWFLLTAGDIGHRAELGMRGGVYDADADSASYWFVSLGGGVAYSFGGNRQAKTWDTSARIEVEQRRYDEAAVGAESAEHHVLWSVAAECDRWLSESFAIGAYARYGERSSNLAQRDYDRAQIGLRLTGAW